MEAHELKIISVILGSVAVLSIGGAVYLADKNKDLNRKMALQTESMESAKQKDQKKIADLTKDLQNVNQENIALNEEKDDLSNTLKKREALLGELRMLNQKRLWQIDTMQAELSENKTLAEQLEKEWNDQKNQLENELAAVNERLRSMVPATSVTADGFLVKATKRNDKVTAKAKKVHDLEVSFNIPNELKLEGSKTIFLSLTDLKGNSMATPLSKENVGGKNVNYALPIHATRRVDFSKDTDRVTFVVNSLEDVEPGTYRASVYTQDRYLGSVEFPFRDSFWFF